MTASQIKGSVLTSTVSLVFDRWPSCSIVHPIQKAIFISFHPGVVSFRLKPTYPTDRLCDMAYVLTGNSMSKHQQWRTNARSPGVPFSSSLCLAQLPLVLKVKRLGTANPSLILYVTGIRSVKSICSDLSFTYCYGHCPNTNHSLLAMLLQQPLGPFSCFILKSEATVIS